MYEAYKVGNVDLREVAEIWEVVAREALGSHFGGPPSFLDVYGAIHDDEGNLYFMYEVAANDPLIRALCEKANNMSEDSIDGLADVGRSAHVAYALVGLDFGPSYLHGFA